MLVRGCFRHIKTLEKGLKVKRKLLIFMGIVSLVSGCAQAPVNEKAEAPPAPTCADCAVKAPYYAVAVTRPALCNDYPVEYRVQVPESDTRIRQIDRIVMGDGVAQVQGLACWK